MKDRVSLYEEIIAKCPRFERKGKANPYTSANGYMFSQLNKDNELGIRFSKEIQEKYIKQWNSDYFKSYGATMKGYVLVPEAMWENLELLAQYLDEGYDYVMSLPPK